MGLRKILTDKDPALHKVCRPVDKLDRRLHKLLDDMTETLADANGVGLAAPQVGILRRVVVVDTGDEILELVNPELVDLLSEQGRAFVPVSIALDQGATVITGANMGGKSVAMKTVALNALHNPQSSQSHAATRV